MVWRRVEKSLRKERDSFPSNSNQFVKLAYVLQSVMYLSEHVRIKIVRLILDLEEISWRKTLSKKEIELLINYFDCMDNVILAMPSTK